MTSASTPALPATLSEPERRFLAALRRKYRDQRPPLLTVRKAALVIVSTSVLFLLLWLSPWEWLDLVILLGWMMLCYIQVRRLIAFQSGLLLKLAAPPGSDRDGPTSGAPGPCPDE